MAQEKYFEFKRKEFLKAQMKLGMKFIEITSKQLMNIIDENFCHDRDSCLDIIKSVQQGTRILQVVNN